MSIRVEELLELLGDREVGDIGSTGDVGWLNGQLAGPPRMAAANGSP